MRAAVVLRSAGRAGLGRGPEQDQIGELIHDKEWPTIRNPKLVAKVGAWAKDKIAGGEGSFIKPWMIDLADAHYPLSIDMAREKLRWHPGRRPRETPPEMIRRLRGDPERWYEINRLGVVDAGS